MGRNVFIQFGVIRQITPINGDIKDNQEADARLENLIEEHDDIFTGLGKIAKFEHKIYVDPSVKPVSQKVEPNSFWANGKC